MAFLQWLRHASRELGLTTVLSCPLDVHLLLATRTLRMMAYGSSTLILALYFSALGNSEARIGLFMSLTLVGDVLISLLLTLVADSLGRRRVMMAGALLMASSGAVFAVSSNFWVQLIAAVVGVISPSGNEIGPFRAAEESTLAKLVKPAMLSDLFAWYVVIGSLATAAGSLACGWATQSLQSAGWSDIDAYRFVFWCYAGIGAVKAGVTIILSKECEIDAPVRHNLEQTEESERFLSGQDETLENPTTTSPTGEKNGPRLSNISPSTRIFLYKFCFLTFLDAFASGMAPPSLLSFFMDTKFGIPEGTLGTIMATAMFVSGIGNIFSSPLARRIGYIKTMAFTHLPSAIFLALIPAPGSLALTVILIVTRYGMATMDQGPRTAFISAVVLPEERTAVMGITGTVRTASQTCGPFITGLLAGDGRFWVAFVVSGSMKALYDVVLLAMFANTKIEGDMPSKVKLENGNDFAAEEQYELASGHGSSCRSSSEHAGKLRPSVPS